MSKPLFAKIETAESLTIFLDDKSYTVRKDAANYKEISKLVEEENLGQLRVRLAPTSVIKSYSQGKLDIVDGQVTLDGEVLHNAAAKRITDLMKAGKKFDYMMNFLKNLVKNPSKTAIDELYLFLEHGNIPITPDGYFLAYRKVDNNYRSFHVNPDGTYNSNKPGETVEMDSKSVDTNRHNTCSAGLHFCSFSYLNHYHGGYGKVVIVKINPANVVSIPSDYNNSKGRCWKYEVVAEHKDGETKEAYKDVVLANPDGTAFEGGEIDAAQKIIAKKARKKQTTLSKRVKFYIENKHEQGISPTLRQIQSSFSPNVPDLKGLQSLIKRMKYPLFKGANGALGSVEVGEK